ncbi:MAG: ArsR/SmtB family transcription factor [Solirubrobacterales bacterium]
MSFEAELLCADRTHAQAARTAVPSAEHLEETARLAKAFAEPNRVAIAAALSADGELCGCDLSEILRLPQNLVSHHLGKMRSAGASRARRDGKLVMHSLTDDGMRAFIALGGGER